MAQLLANALQWALAALGTWGYLIVLVATIMENVFILGSFTPGDILTASAAFTATTPEGAGLNPLVLFALATIGSFIGGNISYWVGRLGGRGLIERSGPRFGIKVESIEAGEEYFERHGSPTIVFARFVAVMKNMAPALAGASRMDVFWFEVYNFVGSAGYAAILVAIGWFLGANFRAGLKYLGAFGWVVFVVAIALLIVAWRAKRGRDARIVSEEAAEFEAEHGRLACDGDGAEAGDREDGPHVATTDADDDDA